MSICPRCRQPVEIETVRCPYCGNLLKAYGHPGIPLHQATKATFLCNSCTYDEDDTCTFPQRPHAKTCTLYHDNTQIPLQPVAPPIGTVIKTWLRRNKVLLFLLGLIAVSIFLTLIG